MEALRFQAFWIAARGLHSCLKRTKPISSARRTIFSRFTGMPICACARCRRPGTLTAAIHCRNPLPGRSAAQRRQQNARGRPYRGKRRSAEKRHQPGQRPVRKSHQGIPPDRRLRERSPPCIMMSQSGGPTAKTSTPRKCARPLPYWSPYFWSRPQRRVCLFNHARDMCAGRMRRLSARRTIKARAASRPFLSTGPTVLARRSKQRYPRPAQRRQRPYVPLRLVEIYSVEPTQDEASAAAIYHVQSRQVAKI